MKSIGLYDADGDGQVSALEIANRLRTWQSHGMGMKVLQCQVVLAGRPLEGATVRFVPERFLGEAVKPAVGTTNRRGMATLAVASSDLPSSAQGVQAAHVGVYKVEVSHPDQRIEPRYNTNTTMGQGPSSLTTARVDSIRWEAQR